MLSIQPVSFPELDPDQWAQLHLRSEWTHVPPDLLNDRQMHVLLQQDIREYMECVYGKGSPRYSFRDFVKNGRIKLSKKEGRLTCTLKGVEFVTDGDVIAVRDA